MTICLYYPVYMGQNYPDRYLDEEILTHVNSIWIATWINVIKICEGLRCNNARTMNNNVMCFVVLNNECPV